MYIKKVFLEIILIDFSIEGICLYEFRDIKKYITIK